jgi:hypothetical protein
MKAGRWLAGAAVIALGWLGLAWCAGPADAHDYRRTAVSAAQAGLNAVRTAALAGAADRDGKLVDPYLSVVLDDAGGAIAGAQGELAAQGPPDAATRTERDQLTPLLVDAGHRVGDLNLALADGDRNGADAAVAALHALGDRFDAFVEQYR